MEQIRWSCTCQHYWNLLVLFASGHQLLLRVLTDEGVSTWQEAAPQLLLPSLGSLYKFSVRCFSECPQFGIAHALVNALNLIFGGVSLPPPSNPSDFDCDCVVVR